MKLFERQRLQEEDPEDGKDKWKMFKKCTKDKDYKKKIQKMENTNRRYSRMYERQRLQEEDPEDGKDK